MVSSLAPLIAQLPLFERLIALSEIMGEPLTPAVYRADAANGSAQLQTANLRPDSAQGPFVAHGISVVAGGVDPAATDVRATLIVNGQKYLDSVMLNASFGTLNQPVVIITGSQAQLQVSADSGLTGLSVSYNGWHITDRFAAYLRRTGELWGIGLTLTGDSAGNASAEARVLRPTMVELCTRSTVTSITAFRLTLGKARVTPVDLTSLASVFGGFGFGRLGPAAGGGDGELTSRLLSFLPSDGRILANISMVTPAETVVLTFIGREAYTQ